MSTATESTVRERVAAVGYDFYVQQKDTIFWCPLCGDGGGISRSSEDRYGFGATTMQCRSCGFLYLSNRLTREGYADLYAHWYRPLVNAFSGFETTIEQLQEHQVLYAQAMANACSSLAAKPYRRTALDIGGSTGVFADELRKRWGYRVAVLDPAPDELAKATDREFEVIPGLVEDFDTDRQFDLISMIQTVDHLLDPVAALNKVHKWLSPHGVFLIDFVDYTVIANAFGIEQAIKIDHPLYFTAKTAELLLALTGFEPVIAGRTQDRRHMVYVCHKVPPLSYAEVAK